MKLISETSGVEKLTAIHGEFAREVVDNFEHHAKPCEICETPGACCLDEHFVNVHISRLEAVAIRKALGELSEERRAAVHERIEASIKKYDLGKAGDTFSKTYACPLFEKGIGCLVHRTAKPLACIAHACYEKKEDLPPGELLAKHEIEIDKLNERVYGKSEPVRPLPVAIRAETRP